MKTQKTNYASYCLNNIAEGCKFCVKGEKIVLFISGKCKRNCWYCSLSKKRKNKDKTWCNERLIKKDKDLIEEVKESNAKGAGITGGDPLICFNRTLKFARMLKNKFGENFHTHIYLPTRNVSLDKLAKLSRYIDEVRFHPEFLINRKIKDTSKSKDFEGDQKFERTEKISDVEKIRLAGFFWSKKNIGIELPLIPDKKKEILDFILKSQSYIGFVNLNEFELSESNFNLVTGKYKLKEGGYVISKSKEAGLWILRQLEKRKIRLKVHLCTADLKNQFQFRSRLLRHKILPYGRRTGEGTVVYLTVKGKNKKELNKLIKKLKGKKFYIDKVKNRIILSVYLAKQLIGKKKIYRVEEFPTHDRIEIEKEELR